MDVAEKLLDELQPWVELQKEGAAKLKKLATEMEERRKNVNVSKVVGSSVSVGGAVALTAAGILTFFTGGLAAPLLVTGAVATGAGLTTNVGADIVDAVKSSGAMKEAEEVSEKIQRAEKKIQRLLTTLRDEQQKDDPLPADNYVMERILRAMAKRKGLILPDGIAGGAAGLIFSVTELVINCKALNNCETEASQRLRRNAEDIQEASEEFKKNRDEIEKLIERLACVKLAIETTKRSSAQKNTLLEFAIEICEDETVRQWLRENSTAFFHLIDMFNLVREYIYKNKERGEIDIIFVAHGSIRDEKHPAVCLLPLPSIEDVLLYSPWNCAITAEAAYGIATGLIQPQHRVFYCRNKKQCDIPDEGHHPSKLPPDWNSMKRAGVQLIPRIMVSPLRLPKDGAWEAFKSLTEIYGQPDRSRIVIPFLFPGDPIRVPFYVVTLALSLALFFSGYEATIHLAACLGDSSRVKFDRKFLEDQYSYTIDNSAMSSSDDMFPLQHPDLYEAFQAVFVPAQRIICHHLHLDKSPVTGLEEQLLFFLQVGQTYFHFHIEVLEGNSSSIKTLELNVVFHSPSSCLSELSCDLQQRRFAEDTETSIMATADELLEKIFAWMEKNERCEEQLRKLADKLESYREKCQGGQCVGSSVAVAGVACTIAATLMTGGAAAPFLGVLGGAYTGVGTAISLSSDIVEIILSSGPMKEAKEAAEKSAKIENEIQQLFEKLRLEQRRRNPSADLDALDQYVVLEIVKAIARRRGLGIPMDMACSAVRYLYHDKDLQIICAATLGILAVFAIKLGGTALKNLYKRGAEKLSRVMSSTAGRSAAKIASAVGMVFTLREAIDNWTDVIKKNHTTEASRSVRAKADEIREVNRALRSLFDDIWEMLKEMNRR
ncbi:hypothetical protein INR49_007069 [Caranx melampygus]|nr:hypothetical protein INR49_007069 [Caranx melampygus]